MRRATIMAAIAAGMTGAAAAQGTLHEKSHAGMKAMFGAAVAGAGDVDGDGHADFLAGAPGAPDGSDPGFARVFSGKDGSLLHEIHGSEPGDRLGAAVAILGDLDGDGADEFAVGAPQDGGYAYPAYAYGYVAVHSGASGAAMLVVQGLAAGDAFGRSLQAVGDMNGDGRPDLLVGAPGADVNGSGSGSAYLVSGSDGSFLRTWHGAAAEDWFGRSVAVAGDADLDGSPDLLVGAYGCDELGEDAGRAFLYAGGDGGVLQELAGSEGAWAGWSLAGIGDVDGDGSSDVLVGHYLHGPALNGRAQVHAGATGHLLYQYEGDLPFDLMGSAVAGIGDADGDGVADFAVGASEFCVPGDFVVPDGRGYVRIFSGRDGSVVHTDRSDQEGSGLGDSLARAGDVNQDGKDDVVVGVPGAGDGGMDSGAVRVVSPADQAMPVDDLVAEVDLGGDAGATIPGLAGMKLKMKVEVTSGDLVPRLRLFNSMGDAVAVWDLEPAGQPQKKTLKLAATDRYRLQIRGRSGTSGTCRVELDAKLPSVAKPHKFQGKSNPEGWVTRQFLALPGTSVDLVVQPKGEAPPAMVLIGHQASEWSAWDANVTAQLDSPKPGSWTVQDLALPGFGLYEVDLYLGPGKHKYKLKVVPSALPEGSEVVLP